MQLYYLLIVLLLTGCGTKTVYIEKPGQVLPWPSPVSTYTIDSLFIDDQANVCIAWEDYGKLASQQQDMLRYIKDIRDMVCAHQPEDLRCTKSD